MIFSVFSLTGTSLRLIEHKETQLSERFKWLVLASAAGGAIGGLVPGGAVASHLGVDIPIFQTEMYFQKRQLGIDEESLHNKAKSCGLCKTAFLDQIWQGTQQQVNSSPDTQTDDPFWGNIFGGLLSGYVSGVTTYFILKNMLSVHKDTAEGCIKVIQSMADKALDDSTDQPVNVGL